MSKLWKGVKKVFKKVGKFVKKYWKVIVIAAAIYFTAGIALAAMPSTAAFSAAMPGFGVGGIFSNAAVSLGATGAAGSGIAGTVAANAAAAAGAAAASGAAGASAAAGGSGLGLGAGSVAGQGATLGAAGGMPGAVGGAYTGAQAASITGMGGATAGTTAAASTTAAAAAGKGAGILQKTSAAVKGMSGLEKVALASTVFKGVGGLLSPSEDKLDRKAHARRYGQSFGIGRDGTGPGYQGLVKNAFAGRFGPEDAGDAQATPFSAPLPPAQDSSPFNDMAQSEADSSSQREYINRGYKQKNYSPI